MSIRDRAAEAMKRVEAATPGPYRIADTDPAFIYASDDDGCNRWDARVQGQDRRCAPAERAAVAAFFVNARADVPDFAGAVLRLTAPEMRTRIRCEIATEIPLAYPSSHIDDAANAIMSLLLAVVEKRSA